MNACDLIIEAIVESEEVKKKLFIELDRIAKASAILASNTSSISITRLATATKRPAQVVYKIVNIPFKHHYIVTSKHSFPTVGEERKNPLATCR